jgi:hypothetical protein
MLRCWGIKPELVQCADTSKKYDIFDIDVAESSIGGNREIGVIIV